MMEHSVQSQSSNESRERRSEVLDRSKEYSRDSLERGGRREERREEEGRKKRKFPSTEINVNNTRLDVLTFLKSR